MTWRWKISSVPMSLATAVMMPVSSVRSSARRAGPPNIGVWKSATTSIASVAEPPLPSAISRPPASRRSRRTRGGAQQRVAAVVQRLRAQRGDLVGLEQHRLAHVVEDLVEVVLLLAEERIQKARGAGVVDGLGPASLEQAAMVEEDVDELPQQVVERLDDLLADERVGDGGEVELPLGAGVGLEGDRQAAALARRGERRERVGMVAEGHRDVLALGLQRDLVGDRAALAGERQRGQRALADDHRMDELDRDVARVGAVGGRGAEGHETALAREALGHLVAQAREAVGLSGEEAGVGLAALAQQGLHPLGAGAGGRAHTTGRLLHAVAGSWSAWS